MREPWRRSSRRQGLLSAFTLIELLVVSYVFNGVTLYGCSNISGMKVSSIRPVTLTILNAEYAAHGPITWHEGKSKFQSRTNKAKSNLCYLDGHVSYTPSYFNGLAGPWCYTPLPDSGFEYVWYQR